MSQYGARQHYATPRAFERQGELRRFYTEAWARPAVVRPILTRLGPRHRAFAGRYSPDIPDEKVVAFTATTMLDRVTRPQRVPDRSREAIYTEYIREGERFAARVNRHLFRFELDPDQDVFYGCQSVCLETLQRLREREIFSVVDQFDPARVEQDLVEAEREKWPGWEASSGRIPEAYFERLGAEWAAASVVLVYSPWTKDAIVQQGVPAEKVIVVPLAYEPSSPRPPAPPTRPADRPLTVLWLGTVMLRKGIPYLLEAARRLAERKIRFVVAGQVEISEQAVKSAPPNVQFVGRVVRAQTEAVYRDADVFVLPTISDSFALTQVEAMAQGLPVIATPRCGQVVSDGVDGRIVPVADAEALASAIAQLDDDRALLEAMSAAARVKSRHFSLAHYGAEVRSQVLARRPALASVSA